MGTRAPGEVCAAFPAERCLKAASRTNLAPKLHTYAVCALTGRPIAHEIDAIRKRRAALEGTVNRFSGIAAHMREKQSAGRGEEEHMSRTTRKTFALFTGVSIAAFMTAGAAAAQQAESPDEGRVTGEIVVTAEKREASIQEVPIAISAFDESRLERLQLNDAQDLQLAIPNFQFSKQNFTGSNVAIRGVGTKVIATSSDAAVGIHINGAPVGSSPIFESEFYDVQRVEVLRGPQGTLYGRNSSAGVLNIITAKPELEEWTGRLEGTFGNYNTYKTNGFLNVPLGDSAAMRLAGFFTQRDGFTEDVASGKDVDGRNMYSVRGSFYAQLSDDADVTLMVQYFKEDSNRSRIGKQLCARDNRPWPFSQGCLPRSPGFETVNISATLGGLGALIFPGTTMGIPGLQPTLITPGNETLPANFGVNIRDLRKVSLTFQPEHENEDFLASMEFNFDFGDITFTSLTSFQSNQLSSKVDYNQYIGGPTFNATLLTPTGTFTGPFTGTRNRVSTYDVSNTNVEGFTQEFRFTSDFDGPINFTLGGIYISSETTDASYKVFSNSLEAIGQGLGIPFQDQWYFDSFTDLYKLEASALFGEVYWQATDDLRVVGGLRWTSDEKTVRDRQTLLQQVPRGSAPLNTRTAKFEEMTGRFTVNWDTALPFTEETNFYASYARGYKGGGINPPFDPALFRGVATTFDPEFVNAYEFGAKNVLGDGRMTANFAGFYYDYEGYQITRIINRTSVNANIDATLAGVEAEITWEPVNGLVFDVNVGYLSSEIGESRLIDPINVTNGNAAYTNVQDALVWSRQMVFSSGGTFLGTFGNGGSLSAVPAGSVVRQVSIGDIAGASGAGAQGAAVGIISNPALGTISTAAQCIVPLTAITAISGINPALMPFACSLARNFGGDALAGSDGIARSLSGNKLPNTPEYTVSLGGQYSLPLWGDIVGTGRVDFFYQADSFARIFNAPNDTLDSYTQWNASFRMDSEESGWYANIFVKNITDEDVITDYYLTDQSSGLFTNAFLLEPRTFGVTLGRRW
jgi:outer membrane receptor protein involved in Fe transport